MRKAFIMASILLSMLQAGTASAVTENSVASNEQLTSAAWTNLREIAKLRPIVRVVHIDTSSPSGITRENILRLIPSAKEGDVRLSRLEKELQLVSDGGLPVTALLKEASSGCSLLIIAGAPSETLSVEKPDDGTSKTSAAWQRGNITNRGDPSASTTARFQVSLTARDVVPYHTAACCRVYQIHGRCSSRVRT